MSCRLMRDKDEKKPYMVCGADGNVVSFLTLYDIEMLLSNSDITGNMIHELEPIL